MASSAEQPIATATQAKAITVSVRAANMSGAM